MSEKLKITILGSGTSTGVPVIGCECSVCRSGHPKNQRSRAAIMISNQHGKNIVVDTGPEFRLQMLREKVRDLHGVLYTHLHADHCNGFDDLRAFFFHHGLPIKCFLAPEHLEEMKRRFSYAFNATGYLGTKPQVDLFPIKDLEPFQISDFSIESFQVDHGDVKSSVFRIGRFAYATDFKAFTQKQVAYWRGKVDVMVASGIHFGVHRTHSVIPETLRLFEELQVKQGIITHLAHDVDYERDSPKLPANAALAYDGMTIDVN